MIELREATLADALALAADMREADAAELVAEGYPEPLAGVLESMEISIASWAAHVDGELVGIIGYATPELIGRAATPWMITTRAADRHRVAFARASRRIVGAMREEFGLLENWVDARHKRSIEWLRWLGFRIHPAMALPPHGHAFHRFEIGGP